MTTRKACKTKIKRKTCRGFGGRRYECPLKLRRSDVEIYAGAVHHKKGWVSIGAGQIYLSKDYGRTVWYLSNMESAERPTIRFNDDTQTIRVNSYKIIIKHCAHYNRAKEILTPFI